MAQNKLEDLNNHLFAQLERLGEEDLSPEELKKEIDRSKSINVIARNLIDNAKTQLDAMKVIYEFKDGNQSIPELFENKK